MSNFKHFLPFAEREAGYWFSCEYPERPIDDRACFVHGCHGCEVAFEAAVHLTPDRRIRINKTDEELSYRELYERQQATAGAS